MDERRFFDRVVIVRRLIHLKYNCRSINRKNAFDIFSVFVPQSLFLSTRLSV